MFQRAAAADRCQSVAEGVVPAELLAEVEEAVLHQPDPQQAVAAPQLVKADERRESQSDAVSMQRGSEERKALPHFQDLKRAGDGVGVHQQPQAVRERTLRHVRREAQRGSAVRCHNARSGYAIG